jgi:chromosome segregation ATPase
MNDKNETMSHNTDTELNAKQIEELLDKLGNEIIQSQNKIAEDSAKGKFSGLVNEKSSYVKEILEKLNSLKYGWDVLKTKKDKLKKTAYMCSQELKKSRQKVKELTKNLQTTSRELQQRDKEAQNLNDRIIMNEEKLEYYKKQEMEISLARSYKSTTSDDLNTKLIHQNQEILDRFHREEERCREIEEENEKLRDQKEKASKKILKLKMDINRLMQEKEANIGGGDHEAEELRERLHNLREERDALEEEKEILEDEKEKTQIACDTYERKLNELIDKHNEDVIIYEEEIEKLREEMVREKADRENKNESLKKLFNSQIGESDSEFTKLKESLIHNKQLETENQNLRAENAELKLDLLNIKQKQMILMNRYSNLKKKMKSK